MWRVEGKISRFQKFRRFFYLHSFFILLITRSLVMGSCFYQEPLVSCYYPLLRFLFFFFNRKISRLSRFDRNAWMFKAWINSAPNMAYSACRQYSWKSLIPLKTSSAKELLVLLGYPYSARILLGIRRNFRPLGPYLYYFRKYKKEPRPNPIRLIRYLLCVAKL